MLKLRSNLLEKKQNSLIKMYGLHWRKADKFQVSGI